MIPRSCPLTHPLVGMVLRAALVVALACMVALVVNVARPGGLPLVLRGVPCPGLPLEWWTKIVHGETLQPVAAMWQSKSAVFVDARKLKDDLRNEDYRFNHIPGAFNLPYNEFTKAFAEVQPQLKPEVPVVVYGYSETCGAAVRVAKLLAVEHGYQVYLLEGGFSAWDKAGLPVKGGRERGEVGVAP